MCTEKTKLMYNSNNSGDGCATTVAISAAGAVAKEQKKIGIINYL